MDFSLIVSQTKTAIDIAKYIKNSKDTLNQSEEKLKLAELIEALADIKMKTAEIKSLMLEKDDEITQLKNELKMQDELVYEQPYYWQVQDDVKDGPFCQKCFDADKKLIRLQGDSNDIWRCLACCCLFTGKDFVEDKDDMKGMYSA